MNDEKKNKLTQEMNVMEKVLQEEQDRIPNYEKRIAGAILDAQKMREESYDTTGSATDPGFYKLELEECLIHTCKQRGLSPNLWALLNLGMHWWNDIQLWAEDVLAGKNILEECKKENAKMRDDLKRVGEEVDDIVNNDEKLSAELTKMNETLKIEKAEGSHRG